MSEVRVRPALMGREAVFFYGALIGIPRRPIRERFDSIVAFSELEPAPPSLRAPDGGSR